MPGPSPASQPIVLQSRIPASATGTTLLAFLQQRFRYRDERGWREELDAGRLQLDGTRATGNEVLRNGMRLRYEKQHKEPPVDANYRVVHEDEQLLAVDKPAHLPMHADGPFIRNTLIHLLRDQRNEPGLQLMHRLDRETSGLCLIARNKTVQALVQSQFLDGNVEKTYVAVVQGRVEAPFVQAQAIGHHTASTVKLRRSTLTPENPQPACTHFEPIRIAERHTLLRCVPKTGRTHQIRVHLEAAGHPVLGDKLYGQDDEHYLSFVRRMKAGGSVFDEGDDRTPHRHLLHAHEIRFEHPELGSQVTYTAPIPDDFERWLLS